MAKHASSKAKAAEPATPATTPANSLVNQRTLWFGLVAVLVVLFFAVYLMRLDNVVGFVVDDAWYVLLAKALATGQGYTLINSPTPGIRPFYAPFFPFLLSLFYRLSPNFPGNLWLLKSVSIAAMLGASGLTYFYFHRVREAPRYAALGLAAATGFYPALVFLATSTVMSECVYTLLLLGAILLVEWAARQATEQAGLRFVALGGVLAGCAFLTRPAGLGLLIGGVLYLFFVRKLRKSALVFAAIVAVIVGPWMIYSRLHQPTPEQRDEQRANIVQPYATQFWQRVAGQPLAGTLTAEDLPERIGKNLSEIARYDLGGVALYPLFRPLEPGESLRIGAEGRSLSLLLTVLALFGFVTVVRRKLTLAELAVPLSLGVTLLWGWEQYRLLLPLVPFLTFYLAMGLHGLAGLVQLMQEHPEESKRWIPASVLIWLIVCASLAGNYQYIQRKSESSAVYGLKWTRAYEENEALMKYCGANLPKDAVLATQNPPLVHLYTGQKTIASDDPGSAWETWKKLGVRYLVHTSPFPLGPPDANERKFPTLYQQEGRLKLRVVDLGEPSSRPPWKN